MSASPLIKAIRNLTLGSREFPGNDPALGGRGCPSVTLPWTPVTGCKFIELYLIARATASLNVGFAEGFDEANLIQDTAKTGSPRGLGKPYFEKGICADRTPPCASSQLSDGYTHFRHPQTDFATATKSHLVN